MNYKKLFTIFLILLPVTNIYGCGVPGISLGKIILIIIVIAGTIAREIAPVINIPRYWWPFILWSLLIPFGYAFQPWFDINAAIYKFIGVAGFWLTLGYANVIIDTEYAFRIYEKAAFVFSLLFLLQSFIYFTTGTNIVLLIPGLPLADSTSIDEYISGQAIWNRQCSVFLEPAYFALYIGILFVMLLERSNGNVFNNKRILFYLFVLLLIRSGNGYICILAALLSYFVMNRTLVFRNKYNIIGILAGVLAAIYLFSTTSDNELVNDTLGRISELSGDDETELSSGFERIYRGYTLFADLKPREQLLGIGQGNLQAYSKTHALSSYLSIGLSNDTLYLNGLQQILVFSGIIGLILWIYGLAKMSKSKVSRQLVIIFLCLCFVSATYNTPIALLIFIFSVRNSAVARV